MCCYIECWFNALPNLVKEVCCSWLCTTDAIRGKVCPHYISVCQLLSLCNCGANHDGDCLGTCRTFMVTMLNCCRGELALSCSLCVGWHKRNLSSLAAASWRQEMGFWDTEEECGMERGWERFTEERGHDYRSTMPLDGWGFIKADTGARETETRLLYKHNEHEIEMLREK